MKIVWLIINIFAASWFSFKVFFNPILQAAMEKWGGSIGDITALFLLVALTILHVAVAVLMCLYVSVGAAVVLTSIMTFGWSLMAYFLLQRFSEPFDRPLNVLNNPLLYPIASLVGFIFSNLSIILFLAWQWIFIPVLVWFFLGFFCAELSIRRIIRHNSDCDRNDAISMINHSQGRLRSFYDMMENNINKYPFP